MLIYFYNPITSEFSSWYNNFTIDEKAQESGQIKRSPLNDLPNHLKITIRYETGEQVSMNWLKAKSYVANKNMPVQLHSNIQNLPVKRDIGDFIVYYDEEHCVSVVFFKNLNVFYGVIGSNYYIDSLPSKFDSRGNYRLQYVGAPYIKKNLYNLNHIHPNLVPPAPSDTEAWEDYVRPRNTLPANASTLYDDYYSSITSTNQQNYYLETLVFICHDIITLFKNEFGENFYIEWIMRYYIIYFQAVDMMFKKARTTEGMIYINIAKIILEDDVINFNFMNSYNIEFNELTGKLSRYLLAHNHKYPEDSFDNVFIHTNRPVRDESILVHAISRHGEDLTFARKNNRFYRAVPFTIMQYRQFQADYVMTVHAFARIFDINVDPREHGLTEAGQCYGIMQRGGSACNKCFKWSERSRARLTVFLRSNTNRCFLLNYPRSLRKPKKNRLILPNQTCACYGYHSYLTDHSGTELTSVDESRCGQPLTCIRYDGSKRIRENIIRPFDGTPCHNEGKVCWNQRCVKHE